jgi:hypothetical protein
MAKRREQPALQTSGQTWQIRLPDGTTREMPREEHGAAGPGSCCFCGRELGDAAAGRVLLTARWEGEDGERAESWSAHRTCLAERLHASAAGSLRS